MAFNIHFDQFLLRALKPDTHKLNGWYSRVTEDRTRRWGHRLANRISTQYWKYRIAKPVFKT